MSQGKRHVSACLLLAALASAPQMSAVADDTNGIDTIARIIGGRDADANSWPSLVALVRSGTFTLKDRFFCGATVVAERWAMTAAHCVYDAFGRVVQPSSLRVVAGVRNLESDVPNEETIVSNIIVHPDYDNTNNLPPNDIALLELATAIDAPVVNLFPGETENYNNMDSYIAGWGATRFANVNDADYPDQLQEAVVPLVPLARCNSIVSYQGLVTERQVCAGFIEGGTDSCAGDSGGPLFIIENGEIIQMGITSFGNDCALPNFYGIYTSVSHFLPWLSNYIDVPFQDPDLIARRQSGGGAGDGGGSSSSSSGGLFGAVHPISVLILLAYILNRRRGWVCIISRKIKGRSN